MSFPCSSVTPDDWEDFSNANIIAAEKQRNNSVALRTLIDGVLQSTANDRSRQKEAVDIAMTKRIAETRDSKEKLEDHLSKVSWQRFSGSEHIEEAWSKWTPFRRWHFQVHFLQWKSLNFI